MKIEFDPAKNEANLAKHGISLVRASDLDMLAVLPDGRFEDEERFRAWGLIDGAYYCLAFTVRGKKVRAISLRRAHKKEIARYAP
ncbi:MAG: BrnT family toxin [Parvibaculaceae bacterium]|nr:BrnT family toxin [Parvibaculaceae bacterium]